MVGVTVKVAAAEFVPSLAIIVCDPATDAGIVSVRLNPPVEEVVIVEGEVMESVTKTTPSYVIEMGDDAAKPFPVTVAVEPTCPLVGEIEIELATVNMAEMVFELESVRRTV